VRCGLWPLPLRVAPKAHKSGTQAATSGNTAPHSACRACCRYSHQQEGSAGLVVPRCDVGGGATLSGYGTLIGVPYVSASSHTSNDIGLLGSQPLHALVGHVSAERRTRLLQ